MRRDRRHRRQRLVGGAVAGLLVIGLQGFVGPAGADTDGTRQGQKTARPVQSTAKLIPTGKRSLRAIAARTVTRRSAPAANGPEIPHVKRPNAAPDPRRTPAITPNPRSLPVTSATGPAVLRFDALRHSDSRFADNGNQFSGEPPDQALCVGNGFTLEGVNQVITVYSSGLGSQLIAPVTLNQLYGVPPAIRRDRANLTFGPDIFDPVCQYEADIQRWFFVTTELDLDTFDGSVTGGSHLLVAVSLSADPTGEWATFAVNTTGGEPGDAGCPCFEDFPMVGADATALYVTINRFSVFGPQFNGPRIYAVSKRGLAGLADGTGTFSPPLVLLNPGSAHGVAVDTIQPATVPPGGAYPANRQFFLSALDTEDGSANRIAVWSLRNTRSLDTDTPTLRLTNAVVSSLPYAFPSKTPQKRGQTPLAQALGEPLNGLDSGDDNMRQVVYADGKLWSTISTAIGPTGGRRTGFLWLQVRPGATPSGAVTGRVVKQGYVAVAGNSTLYPALAVNPAGRGAVVFSLAGPFAYPSAAFVSIDGAGTSGPVKVLRWGAGPEDGFSCYAAFGSRRRGCRWGDYSAACADESGDIWMATEAIPTGARTDFANWGTVVARVRR